MKKDDKKTLIVILIICIICCFIVFILTRKSNTDKLSFVDDYSTFFSVTGEVDNYINYIAKNDKNNIIKLLDKEYINSNNIEELEFDNYTSFTSFEPKKIDYVKIGKNYLYLVNGIIIDIDYYTTTIIDDNFMVLVLNDVLNNSYSVYPVDSKNYEETIDSIKKINIDNNDVNVMIKSKQLSDTEVCKLYFSDYVSKLLNNTRAAYDILDGEMKKKFASYDDFDKQIKDNLDKFTSLSKLCKKDEYKNGRIYSVIDNNENSYFFTENGVMNYTVSFYFKKADKFVG